ncbi:MAG TPA: PfkB family carbohydrate kinase [Vicinamibacterales bacterium]|nr:PfkB family carbohydrate kinase [Vicinamibacterales bacterium]
MKPKARLARYLQLIKGFRRVRLVVIGDLVADEFIYGQLDRVSREAPVLILKYDSTEVVPGGAGNAAANAAMLGARVEVVGIVGRDDAGARLLGALPRSARASGVVRASGYVTPVKTRILAGGVHSAKQQVVRIDRAGGRPSPSVLRQVERASVRAIRRADAVIISDYGGGLATPDLWRRVRSAAGGRVPPLVFVDSRYALDEYVGVTACTPNESEVEALLGQQIDDVPGALESSGRALLDTVQCQAVLVTRGSRGMALFEPGHETDHIPIVGSDEVADVTGAGDTVIATFALAAAAGASFAEAARLANYAGGLVVMKRGTATVTGEELGTAIERDLEPGRRRS